MAKRKFKTGDVVRCVDANASKVLKLGMVGVVALPAYVQEGEARFLRVKTNGEIYGWREFRWELDDPIIPMPDMRNYLNALSEYRTD